MSGKSCFGSEVETANICSSSKVKTFSSCCGSKVEAVNSCYGCKVEAVNSYWGKVCWELATAEHAPILGGITAGSF